MKETPVFEVLGVQAVSGQPKNGDISRSTDGIDYKYVEQRNQRWLVDCLGLLAGPSRFASSLVAQKTPE